MARAYRYQGGPNLSSLAARPAERFAYKNIPNLLYHGGRGFYIGPVSSLGCGAAPGGLPLLAPAGRVSFVQLPEVAAFGATTGRGISTSPGLASGVNLCSSSLMAQNYTALCVNARVVMKPQ